MNPRICVRITGGESRNTCILAGKKLENVQLELVVALAILKRPSIRPSIWAVFPQPVSDTGDTGTMAGKGAVRC